MRKELNMAIIRRKSDRLDGGVLQSEKAALTGR